VRFFSCLSHQGAAQKQNKKGYYCERRFYSLQNLDKLTDFSRLLQILDQGSWMRQKGMEDFVTASLTLYYAYSRTFCQLFFIGIGIDTEKEI
jgi:hypothetical protein